MKEKNKNKKTKVYYSPSQLKQDFFPQLIKSENIDSLKSDYKQIGTVLANQAIEELIAHS